MKWVDIEDSRYSVSDTGLVRANARIIQTVTGPRKFKEKILKPEVTHDGHLRVVLCNAGVQQKVFVHRLVAMAFLPNPNNYPIVNHKDENPANNNVSNLEWCTYSYNNNYNNRQKKIGEKEGSNIIVYDKDFNELERFASITAFSKKYNYPLTTCWRRAQNNKLLDNKYYLILEEDQ